MIKATAKQVGAVVVTYHPDDLEGLFARIMNLADEVGYVVISDNSERLDIAESIRNFATHRVNIVYIGDGKNKGIGKAQNIAFRMEEIAEVNFFITFDQDSNFFPGFVKSLCETLNSVRNSDEIACLGPTLVNQRSGEIYRLFIKGTELLDSRVCLADFIASSGMLISKRALQDVGAMREEWFIDLLDIEWCYRAKSKGYLIAVALDVQMLHQFGQKDIDIPVLGKVVIPAPARMYYIVRNTLYMARLSYIPIRKRAGALVVLAIKIPIYIMNNCSAKRLKLAVRGFKDGIFGEKIPNE